MKLIKIKTRVINIIRCWIWANMHHPKRFPLFSKLNNPNEILTCPWDVLSDYKLALGLNSPYLGHLDFDPNTGFPMKYLQEDTGVLYPSQEFNEFEDIFADCIDPETGKRLSTSLKIEFDTVDDYMSFLDLAEAFVISPEDLASTIIHDFMVLHEDEQNTPLDFLLTAELIKGELVRLGWTEEKAKEQTYKRYGKKSIYLMTEEELDSWYEVLKHL